jgi:hypothetical protein
MDVGGALKLCAGAFAIIDWALYPARKQLSPFVFSDAKRWCLFSFGLVGTEAADKAAVWPWEQ